MCGRTDRRKDVRMNVGKNNCFVHLDAKSTQDINIAGCDNLWSEHVDTCI